MSFICIFFPAVIMCGFRRLVIKDVCRNQDNDWMHVVFEYASSCILLNLLLWIFLAVFRHNSEGIYDKLNMFSVFAIKYLLSAVLAAVLLPVFERFLRKRLKVTLDIQMKLPQVYIPMEFKWISRYGIYILSIAAIGLHFFRIFDDVFWYDEVLPIITEHLGWREMLRQVAEWGHTPLHYIIIWGLCRLVGHSGPLHHFVSLFPYVITVFTSMIFVRKWFGTRTAAILILLSALLENAVRYNVEVRMYSWCQMFIFLAYLMMYQTLRTKRTKNFVFMMFYSLGAVYSHYFALAPIGILYLFLLLYMILTDRRSAWKVIFSGGGVLVIFLPWMWYGYHVRGQFVAHYGNLVKMSWSTCFEYIFSSKYSWVLLLMFIGVFGITILSEIGILELQPVEEGKIFIRISIDPTNWRLSYTWLWCLAGVCSTFGTIIASQWISEVLYPILTERYLYPALILVWLVFGICVSKYKAKNSLTIILVLILAFSCIPSYFRVVKDESHIKNAMEETLMATDEVKQEDYILTNINQFSWPVLLYYYPKTEHDFFSGTSLPPFRDDTVNWLFLGSPMPEDMTEDLQEKGYSSEEVVSNGYVGTYKVWIYKVVRD